MFLRWTKPWFSQDRFNTLAAILMGYIGLLIALNTYEMDVYLDTADLLVGDEFQLTMDTASTLAVGQFDANYSWTQAYRVWLELDSLAVLASYEEDWATVDRYDAIRNMVAELSPLLQEPYFNPTEDSQPDIRAYESDVYVVDLARQQQQLADVIQQRDYWYVGFAVLSLNTRLLAIALTLLGLASTLITHLRVQTLLLVVSSILTAYSSYNTAEVLARPVPDRSEEAIEHFATGAGLYHQQDYIGAIQAFTAAIAADDTLIEAYVQRAFAQRYAFEEDQDLTRLNATTQDLEIAVENGRLETPVLGQLSEAYYLQGDFNEARQSSQLGIENTPDFVHHFDLGRNYLAEGDFDRAQASYEAGFEQAYADFGATLEAEQAVSSYFWRSFDIAMLELDDLWLCATTQTCEGTPAFNQLTQNATLADQTHQLSSLVKTWSASLEFLGHPPTGQSTAKISNLTLTSPDTDLIIDSTTFAYGVRVVNLNFDYEKIPSGAVFAAKVYLGNNQYTPLRQLLTWDAAETGEYTLTFPLGEDLGTYQVQLFVDGQLSGEISFAVVSQE